MPGTSIALLHVPFFSLTTKGFACPIWPYEPPAAQSPGAAQEIEVTLVPLARAAGAAAEPPDADPTRIPQARRVLHVRPSRLISSHPCSR